MPYKLINPYHGWCCDVWHNENNEARPHIFKTLAGAKAAARSFPYDPIIEAATETEIREFVAHLKRENAWGESMFSYYD